MDDFLCRRHFVISYLFFWNHGLNNRCLITTVDSYFCFLCFLSRISLCRNNTIFIYLNVIFSFGHFVPDRFCRCLCIFSQLYLLLLSLCTKRNLCLFCFQHFIWCIFCHNLYFQNGCFLRILCTACAVSARAVIFILPSPTPVITPSSTVATVLSELLHSTGVPSGVTIATTVTVSPTQIFPLSLSSRIVVFSGNKSPQVQPCPCKCRLTC